MTSETEEAVARLRRHAVGAYGDMEDDLLFAIEALTASQAEVERLTRERDEAERDYESNTDDLFAANQRQVHRALTAEARATRAEGLLAEAGEVLGRADLAPDAICKLAFQIRAPNAITPRLVLVANELQHTLRAFLAKLKGEG